MMERLCCQIMESANPALYCPVPATYRATRHIDWFLCKDHAVLALIAGLNPKPITRDAVLKENR